MESHTATQHLAPSSQAIRGLSQQETPLRLIPLYAGPSRRARLPASGRRYPGQGVRLYKDLPSDQKVEIVGTADNAGNVSSYFQSE